MSDEPRAIDLIERSFAWFNDLGARHAPLDRDALTQFFHPDIRLVVGGEVKVAGIEGLYDRFVEMLERVAEWHVPLPFERTVSEAASAAALYRYDYRDEAGRKGGIDIIAIWTLRDGRICEGVELTAFDGPPFELANHGVDDR